MEHLLELKNIINKGKIKFLKTVGNSNDKVNQLYHLIDGQNLLTDDEAINFLFRGKQQGKNLLWRTKNKLYNRLINSLLLLDLNDESYYKTAFFKAYKAFAATKILRADSKKKAFIHLAEKLLKDAIKLQLIDIVLSVAKELRLHYSIVAPSKVKVAYFNAIIDKYEQYLIIENKIEQKYSEFILSVQIRKNISQSEIDTIKSILDDCTRLTQNYQSYWTVLIVSNIKLTYLQLIKDYHRIASTCDEALAYFESLEFDIPRNAKFTFTVSTISSSILSQSFDKAHESIAKCTELYRAGHINWCTSKEYSVICYFHEQEYQKVLKELEVVKQHAKSLFAKESWVIYEAFAKLLTHQKLRLGKFLNEVPKFSKDHRGMNVNILIIQILEYIRRGEKNTVIDRSSALKQYIRRHLRAEDTFRSNCFINMLLCLEKGYFNKIAVQRHAKKYLDGLQQVSLKESQQEFDIEIIPYEDLWDFLLSLL